MYEPRRHWDQVGRASTPGSGDDPGQFGTDQTGNSLYRLPKWSTQPQYWEYMESGNRVLDIGSGNGLQIGRLIQRGVLAIGCDISPALLAVAKRNLVSHGIAAPMLVQWNGFQMPFAAYAFDRVTTNTVLQHVVDDDAVNSIFSETARILKTGGLFLICELICTRDVQTAPHVKLRSPQTYMQIATQHGLRLKRIRHVVSTYVAIQAVYGRFLARSAVARTGQTTYDVKDYPPRNRSIGVWTKRVMRQLVSGFAKLADRVVVFLRIDDKFVGQDEFVFEKLFDATSARRAPGTHLNKPSQEIGSWVGGSRLSTSQNRQDRVGGHIQSGVVINPDC